MPRLITWEVPSLKTVKNECQKAGVNVLRSGYFKQDAVPNKREFTVLHYSHQSILTLKDSFGLGIPNSSYA